MTFAEGIVSSLKKSPYDWDVIDANLKNNDVGICVWIANGFLCVSCDSGVRIATFSIVGKIRIWRAYKKWNKRRFIVK